MKFFSGFCFSGEKELFASYLNSSDFCVAGFSYGAINALKYAIACKTRIDTLQLFSPAFFQDKDEKFKKLQLSAFRRNKQNYMQNFMQNVIFPSNKEIGSFIKMGNIEELEELLYYSWSESELLELIKRGVEIEVYLGEKDAIINPLECSSFFANYATIYSFKNFGHLL